MKIRKAEEKDVEGISELYYGTVRSINSKDYSEKEIEVWSSSAFNFERWKKNIAEQYFLVAEEEEEDNLIIGFSSITPEGYLDFMYVHKDFQRRGVASGLLSGIEEKASEQNNEEIYYHVSRTAKEFFEKSGYVYSGDNTETFKGVVFVNNIMIKKMNVR